ncbi:MAG TPA: peptide deformylase [Thermoanaerobaculia bacterium]|nr:peptide deformylase [Thermoanaerobaculia bacterium]
MPLRPIVRLGHPTLRSVAQALPPGRLAEPAVQELIDDLIETMRAARGVGLAAPQVGTSLQIFVYELAPPQAPAPDAQEPPADLERAAAATIPLHVVVNPMLTPQAGELVYDWEGCLSIPDLRGLVPRHPAVRVRGLDRQGQPLDYVAQGFEARIIQHEHDHLNGVVFLDRMRDLKALAFREEWERYMAPGAAEPPDPLDPQAHSPLTPTAPLEEPVLAAADRDPEVI